MNRRQPISILTSPFAADLAVRHAVAAAEQRLPDVLEVKVRAARAGTFDFDVTVSFVYDTPAQNAGSIRARSKDGCMRSMRSRPMGGRPLPALG